jgi:Skp family chaperone for outer membrane proteins
MMLKKLFMSFVAFALVTVQAQAATNNSLKAAFDELNYSLSVEWDQKDRAFYDAKMKQFQARIGELQAQGLSNSELVDFAKSQVKNEAMARDVETAFSLIQINKMSVTEANTLVRDMVRNSYSTGASWSSTTTLLGGLAILLLVAAIASAGGYGGGCSEYACYDYYDSWGYYWYSDCGYDSYCY